MKVLTLKIVVNCDDSDAADSVLETVQTGFRRQIEKSIRYMSDYLGEAVVETDFQPFSEPLQISQPLACSRVECRCACKVG